jgi:hypothetical protein
MLKNILSFVQVSYKKKKPHNCIVCGVAQDRPFCTDHITQNPYIARIVRVVKRIGAGNDIPSKWNIKESY